MIYNLEINKQRLKLNTTCHFLKLESRMNETLDFDYKRFEKEWFELWFSFIIENPEPEIRWNWHGISSNSNITWDIIQNNPEKPWDWDGISRNVNITWDIIRENPEKPWNWFYISCNPNITWDIIRDNLDKEWDLDGISQNPNISMDIIRENPNVGWKWDLISHNSFLKEKEDFIRNKFRKHFMGKGLGYDEYSLFRELMERVWSPQNLEKNINEI